MEKMDRPRPTLDGKEGSWPLISSVCPRLNPRLTELPPTVLRSSPLCTPISLAVLISRCGHTFIEHKQIGTELCRSRYG